MTAPDRNNSILSLFTRIVPALALATTLGGCDEPDAPDAAVDARAWIFHHLENVRDLAPQDQAEYFAEHRGGLEIVRGQIDAEAGLPGFDLAAGEIEPSAQVDETWCWLEIGCVEWNATQGCTSNLFCVGCTDGHWNCLPF